MYKPEYIPKTVAVIAINCEEPWNAMKSLRQWVDVLMEVLEEHMKELPLEIQDSLHTQSLLQSSANPKIVATYIKKYEPPSMDDEGNLKPASYFFVAPVPNQPTIAQLR